MKKTISIFLAVLMILSCISISVSAAVETAKITLNDATYTYENGTTVVYTCDLSSNAAVQNGQFDLAYPQNLLEITEVNFPVTTDAIYNYKENVENLLIFNFSRPQNFYDFNGGKNLVTVTFKVIGSGEGTINLGKRVLSASNNKDILSDVTFTEKLAGDVYKAPKISQTKRNLFVKQSFQLKVNGGSSKGTVTWKSSNTKIATIKNGKVTAKKAGTVTMTATKDDIKLTCTVVVKKPTVKAKNATIKVKKSTTIIVKNAVGKTKYKSLTGKIAKVSSNGKVTGLKKGNAKIQVTASGIKFTVKIKVK